MTIPRNEGVSAERPASIQLKPITNGAYYSVYEVRNLPLYEGGEVLPAVVVKLLKNVDFTGSLEAAVKPSAPELLAHMMAEQAVVEKYLEPEFLELAYPFNLSELKAEVKGIDHEDKAAEIGLVQAKVEGIECKLTSTVFPPHLKASETFAPKIAKFIEQYNQMRLTEGRVIEDQVFINLDTSTLKVVDTNNLLSFSEMVKGVQPLFEAMGLNFDTEAYLAGEIDLIEQVLKFFAAEFPPDKSQDYYTKVWEFRDSGREGNSLRKKFRDYLNEHYPKGTNDEKRGQLEKAFGTFIDLLTYFPPRTVEDNLPIHVLRSLI